MYAAPRVPQAEDDRGLASDEAASEGVSKQVFTTYLCRTVDRGIAHPGDIAEAASLRYAWPPRPLRPQRACMQVYWESSWCLLCSAIPLPHSNYPLWDSLPPEIVDSGKLSRLQLEGVLYACSKHQQFLPSGERAGFFIGDGAGVGKGRQISGVILDNYARGRR